MEEKSYKAIAKYLLVSPTKVRPVADLVRGKSVPQAAAILEAMPQKGARLILKVLNSATANALYANKKWDEEGLTISELLIDDGPTLKRVWARSHGKRDILIKRMSHITVVVSKALEA
ncbi:MAG: 50S ribosomal protein L22 [Sphaerochaetaceae bacterium]|jgi:large subunit ribosomal protein L22|nr:50S ribosomal protein L22 [Sphaerochaetaceae bacterium]